jgi:hypothetical protein
MPKVGSLLEQMPPSTTGKEGDLVGDWRLRAGSWGCQAMLSDLLIKEKLQLMLVCTCHKGGEKSNRVRVVIQSLASSCGPGQERGAYGAQ